MSGMSHSDRLSTKLQPQSRITARPHRVSDRMKDLQLHDADLYVARLSWKNQADSLSEKPEVRVEASVSKSCNNPRSLHTNPHQNPSLPGSKQMSAQKPLNLVPATAASTICTPRGSNVCSGTIARANGKVLRFDVVDALEAPEGNPQLGLRGKQGIDGFLVTKHEVLRLRERMGV